MKLDKLYFAEYIENDKLNYYKIINNILEFTKLLYTYEGYKNKVDSYYELINKMLSPGQSNIKCSGVLTTNYYKFADIISDDVIYLNGSLNLFEIPETFDVMDLTDRRHTKLNNEKLFFPFIFGQSFVKPIIHKTQIDTFSKAYNLLNDSDVLVILGFNLNEDDNHINSMLNYFVNKGGKIIKVQLKSESKNAHKKIRCNESSIIYCTVDDYDNKTVINDLFKLINEM